jgi:hypothetical protein
LEEEEVLLELKVIKELLEVLVLEVWLLELRKQ